MNFSREESKEDDLIINLSACSVSENDRSRIVRVLMFPVATLNNQGAPLLGVGKSISYSF